MKIQEGNKLIAEFMGITYSPFGTKGMWSATCWYPKHIRSMGTWSCGNMSKKECTDYVYNTLNQFHTSWDWLMPVVQKILNTDTGTLDVYSLYVSDSLRTADINNVFEAVIDFITWYNTNNPKTPPHAK